MKTPIDEVVGAYVKLRDLKKEMAVRHKDELAPLTQKMNTIETYLLMDFNEKGIESARTEQGTAYKVERTSVKAEDWDVFLEWAMDNDMMHCIDRRANKSSVQEFLESTGDLPPGLSISKDLGINIRR